MTAASLSARPGSTRSRRAAGPRGRAGPPGRHRLRRHGLAWAGEPAGPGDQLVGVRRGVRRGRATWSSGAPRPWPGCLPRAVRAFFAQGGQVAWVCRVVPVHDDPAATARMTLAARPWFWPPRTRAAGARSSRRDWISMPGSPAGDDRRRTRTGAGRRQLVLPDGPPLPDASLLAGRCPDGHPAGTLHRLTGQRPPGMPAVGGCGSQRGATAAGRRCAARRRSALVTGTLSVTRRGPVEPREERSPGSACTRPSALPGAARLSPAPEPAYPATVLAAESRWSATATTGPRRSCPPTPPCAPLTAGPCHRRR